MLSLAKLQRGFAQAVLAGDAAGMDFAQGRVSAAAALQVHRNTIIGALVNALRLTYPSVDAVVGEAFFDQAAATFAEHNPPDTARLAGYGEGFGDFLAAHVPSLPYLPDVARLDRAIDRALSCTAATRRMALDQALRNTLSRNSLPYSLVYGQAGARCENALLTIRFHMRSAS